MAERKEVEGGAGGIHRPIKVTPLAFHPDVRLVHAPAVIGGLQVRPSTPLQLGRVSLDPSPYRHVIGVHAPFGEQLFHVAIRK